VDGSHATTLSFVYATPERAERVRRSVAVEAGDIDGGRTRASVSRSAATVTVRIDAADLVALRAGVNTWCTLVAVAESTAEAGAGGA
jgi:KEOPS complex subunit Pcc1